MASPRFLKCLLYDLRLHPLFGIHLLQAPVLRFEFLHALHYRLVHAAVLGPPVVERGIAHAMHAAQIREGNAALGLLEDREDLTVRVFRSLHRGFSSKNYMGKAYF